MSLQQELTTAIYDWDWDSLRILGDHAKVLGHRIKIGSIVELQLSVAPVSVFKFWIRKADRQPEWIIDPSYEASLMLDLGPKSGPVRRIIQPLRPQTNLAYFEGVVIEVARKASKSDEREIVNILLDCGVPVVVESLVDKGDSSPLLGVSAGNEIIGIFGLMGSLSSSPALFKAPIIAKVLGIKSFEGGRPPIVLLTVEVGSWDAVPVAHIHYYALETPLPSP
jgi:hypothetical protein